MKKSEKILLEEILKNKGVVSRYCGLKTEVILLKYGIENLRLAAEKEDNAPFIDNVEDELKALSEVEKIRTEILVKIEAILNDPFLEIEEEKKEGFFERIISKLLS